MIAGRITSITHAGTIVIVAVRTNQGTLVPIYIEHRCFAGLLQLQNCEPHDLIGREVEYTGKVIFFVDEGYHGRRQHT